MSGPKTPDRWDGWDDPDYEPTQSELEEPIIALPPDTTPEDLARALLRPSPPVAWPHPDAE